MARGDQTEWMYLNELMLLLRPHIQTIWVKVVEVGKGQGRILILSHRNDLNKILICNSNWKKIEINQEWVEAQLFFLRYSKKSLSLCMYSILYAYLENQIHTFASLLLKTRPSAILDLVQFGWCSMLRNLEEAANIALCSNRDAQLWPLSPDHMGK